MAKASTRSPIDMLALASLFAATAVAAIQQSDFTITLGSQVSFGVQDDTPAFSYIDKDGKYYFQSSHSLYYTKDSRDWGFWSGENMDTYSHDAISGSVNPANPLDSNANTTWRCNNSPTGDLSTYQGHGGYPMRNYCDLYGVYVDPDTGYWYGLIHNEFTPSPFNEGLHYDSIDSAVSKDQGHTWQFISQIITSPFPTVRNDTKTFPGKSYYYGAGDQRLTFDYATGYAYVWYGSRVVPKSGVQGGYVNNAHVVRSPLKSKFAAGSWQKFYNGAWSEPGLGGKESNLVPTSNYSTGYSPASLDYNPQNLDGPRAQVWAGKLIGTSDLFLTDVAWNAYLGLWIAEPNTNGLRPQRYYATDNLVTQKWTLIGETTGYNLSAWYRWMLDPVSKTQGQVVGKNVRGYCSICTDHIAAQYINLEFKSKNAFSPIDVSKTYKISSPSGSLSSTYKFIATGDGAFTIQDTKTSQYLSSGGDVSTNRAWGVALTTAASATPVSSQWWVIAEKSSSTNAPSGKFRLLNRYSNLVISLPGSKQELVPPRYWNDVSGSSVGGGRQSAHQALTLTAA